VEVIYICKSPLFIRVSYVLQTIKYEVFFRFNIIFSAAVFSELFKMSVNKFGSKSGAEIEKDNAP
jgi:hypothetical protein